MSELQFDELRKKRNERSEELDKLIDEKVEMIDKKRGFFTRCCERIHRLFFVRPLTEIHEDWCTVRGFAMGVRDSIIRDSINRDSIQSYKEGWDAKKQKKWDDKIRRFVTIQAYLKLAKREGDPGQAWRYVNSADKLLTLVIDDKDDFDQCLQRFEYWDRMLPKKLREKYLDEKEKKEEKDIKKKKDEKYEDEKDFEENRKRAYKKQAARVRLWNDFVNSEVSLKISLWRMLRLRLLVGLLGAIFFAEIAYFRFNPGKPWWDFPFVTISVMGFFGGGLSAVILARKNVVSTSIRGEIEILTSSRMLIGAAGALVVYTIIGSGLVQSDFSQLLDGNIFAFLAMGIAAGFSEQLFVGPLSQITKNLNMFGNTAVKEGDC